MLLILTSSLYKCSLKPFLVDNESYYIQTIKWINEYGFVKGLANLHIFLAQTSPLHVLQAGFNFNFWTNNLNDINGLILVIASYFFVIESEKYYLKNHKFHWVNFVLVFNALFFQLIGQPSPDFALIIISQVIFYLFIEEFDNFQAIKISIVLFLFLFFIKITIAPIGLMILIWIILKRKYFLFFVLSVFLVTLILIFKNILITGYPLYPFEYFAFDVDWKIPCNLFNFITDSTKNTGYFENQLVINPTFFQKIIGWLQLAGLNRVFNLGMIFLFVLSLFTIEIRKNKNYKILYLVLLIHFIILLSTSPQFRFFLPEFIFFSLLMFSNIINYLKLNFKIIQISLILLIIFSSSFIEYFDFKNLTDNKLMQENTQFKLMNFLIPENNSKYNYLTFEKVKNGNLEYFSPTYNFFFFGTADGKLPCVNKYQINYLEKYYQIRPQLRTKNLDDGFCSEIIK
ncbi:MAG: hypothetical protein H7174_03575 [Flavobacterium sp.]|nr:hypothetical protein [Flavobacterium sp.]